jgi:hypothetical protein
VESRTDRDSGSPMLGPSPSRIWAPIGKSYRFVFHRKSRTIPSSYDGCFVPDLRGFCVNCHTKPAPEKPGICFCNDGSGSRARARTHEADTKRNND